MNPSGQINNRLILASSWTARILGALLVILVGAFVIGEGFPNPSTLTLRETLLMVAMAIMLIGCILAWKWEGAGGVIILSGFVFFWVINGITVRRLLTGWVFLLFALTGILFLFSWRSKYR